MKIVIDINHPAHVHYFKNFILEMQKKGHETLITASKKEMSYRLLNIFNLDYVPLGSYGSSLPEKVLNLPILDIKMYSVVKRFNPDLFIGFGSIRAAHASKMLGAPCIAFDDTEHAKWEHMLYVPFTDTILTPSSFRKDFGKKQVRYQGCSELLYLHPNRFTPSPAVLTELGLAESDPYVIVRFVSWNANHDVGQHGIRDKIRLVKVLERYGRVLITSEGALPSELQSYQIEVSPEKLHDLLYYAMLYVGEGATTASEAAVLGTPSLFVSSLAGTMGCLTELEETYDLLYSFTDSDTAMSKAVEILQNPASKEKWRVKRERLLKEKIDVTAFLIRFIENYPQSLTGRPSQKSPESQCASDADQPSK